MTIFQAIRKAERVLPGKQFPEGELDARWQAIIAVGDHIEEHQTEVWVFTRKWGAHASADLRTAVETCLLEHLLEYHFDRIFPVRQVHLEENLMPFSDEPAAARRIDIPNLDPQAFLGNILNKTFMVTI